MSCNDINPCVAYVAILGSMDEKLRKRLGLGDGPIGDRLRCEVSWVNEDVAEMTVSTAPPKGLPAHRFPEFCLREDDCRLPRHLLPSELARVGAVFWLQMFGDGTIGLYRSQSLDDLVVRFRLPLPEVS
jgi:hypothetical protein